MKMWAGVAVVALVLAGCSNAGNEAAQAAHDACTDGRNPHVAPRLDGDTIHLEVLGQDAATFAAHKITGKPDVTSLTDEQMEALKIAMSVQIGLDCLLRHTAYPGTADDLVDGDEWDGWRYSEPDTVGSEIRLAFTATG